MCDLPNRVWDDRSISNFHLLLLSRKKSAEHAVMVKPTPASATKSNMIERDGIRSNNLLSEEKHNYAEHQ